MARSRDQDSRGLVVDIKADPFERTPDTGGRFLWMKEKSWILPILAPPLTAIAKSMQEYPVVRKGSGIGAAAIMNQLMERPASD